MKYMIEMEEMKMDYAKESLKKHYEWKGKLEVTARAAVEQFWDLAILDQKRECQSWKANVSFLKNSEM